MVSDTDPRFQMPGFNIQLNNIPKQNVLGVGFNGFPNAIDENHLEWGCLDNVFTFREILMMRVMNSITDKPEWDRKIFDENVTLKWREEVARSGQDVTAKMMDYIIKELQYKAERFQKSGIVPVFDVGVVKSDTAISKELQHDLKQAVVSLENVPEAEKDYHPGSNGKVVDLVHPSLFPVIFGRTRVLPDQLIGIDDCLDTAGQGELLPIVEPEQSSLLRSGLTVTSCKFQWLPCDVEIVEDTSCRIVSYVNNAHPVKHQALYRVVEKILARSIPLWNTSLTYNGFAEPRIQYKNVEYGEPTKPKPTWAGDQDLDGASEDASDMDEDDPEDNSDVSLGEDSDDDKMEDEELDEDLYHTRLHEWENSRPIIRPEPDEFQATVDASEKKVDLREQFPDTKLQVIVKLANIELTPSKPEYGGGSWHLEGALNERICATAIYYYDCQNITENTLAFRQRGTNDWLDVNYEQDRHRFLQEVYGFGPEVNGYGDTQVTQDLGSVACREGRLLTFPNTLQHRVSPFSLEDRSKPGHRKILALFLVDPHRRIISSANVPPQREDWIPARETLEKEIGYLANRFMTMEEAKAERLALVEERSLTAERGNRNFEIADFNLCEH